MSNAVHAVPRADDDFGTRLTALVPNLRAFANTLCRGRGDAEDLMQEAVMNAWKSRESFEPGTNLKAWLFVIQRNAFYSAHRRKWRQVDWDEAVMDRRLVTAPAQQASAELTDLMRAMSALPCEQREALMLVGAGGFSYKRAASMRGCATGTMKSRVSRGRQAVALLLTDAPGLPVVTNIGGAYQAIAHEVALIADLPRCRAH
jgi:RNA polymerase sigma-70 factor (ECF subfamily)